MQSKNQKIIAYWLFICCIAVALMVAIGGITRLTQSGLSMVEWQPIMGVLPPSGEGEWLDVFEKYQSSPEYQKKNSGMELDEFKQIFFWEYLHRLIGRAVGVIFFLPFLYFLLTQRLRKEQALRFFSIFLLGGLQGLIGWYMVKSGLVDRPDVSQYRLALHLGMAFFLYALLFWTGLELYYKEKYTNSLPDNKLNLYINIRWYSFVVIGLISIQVVSGAFVAGLDAGLIYNTFPTMNGVLIPDGLWELSPWYKNIFENIMTVQFMHRVWAMITASSIIAFWFVIQHSNVRSTLSRGDSMRIHSLLIALIGQIILGILTLIHVVPVLLASLHQLGALVVFSLALWVAHGLTHRMESKI